MKLLRKWRAVEHVPDPFIRPDHLCHIPESRSFGYTSRQPKNLDAQPPGTLWVCECGKAWKVEPDLGLWERSKVDDVEELLA